MSRILGLYVCKFSFSLACCLSQGQEGGFGRMTAAATPMMMMSMGWFVRLWFCVCIYQQRRMRNILFSPSLSRSLPSMFVRLIILKYKSRQNIKAYAFFYIRFILSGEVKRELKRKKNRRDIFWTTRVDKGETKTEGVRQTS